MRNAVERLKKMEEKYPNFKNSVKKDLNSLNDFIIFLQKLVGAIAFLAIVVATPLIGAR